MRNFSCYSYTLVGVGWGVDSLLPSVESPPLSDAALSTEPSLKQIKI